MALVEWRGVARVLLGLDTWSWCLRQRAVSRLLEYLRSQFLICCFFIGTRPWRGDQHGERCMVQAGGRWSGSFLLATSVCSLAPCISLSPVHTPPTHTHTPHTKCPQTNSAVVQPAEGVRNKEPKPEATTKGDIVLVSALWYQPHTSHILLSIFNTHISCTYMVHLIIGCIHKSRALSVH